MEKFEAKKTHGGQYNRYGDSFDVWEIKTEASKEETLGYCFENLHKHRCPEYAEWHKNTVYGGAKSGDMGYHFGGYYTLIAIDGGFSFSVCFPYAD